jgi:hypothetical protein
VRRAKGVRERWLTEVLRTEHLNNSAKLVLVALSRQMDERGRVRYARDRLAADVGLATVQRVTDRIKEAKDAGFLVADGGGINGTVAQYYASFPGTPLRGTSSTGRGNGSRGTRNGVPEPAVSGGPGTPPRGAIRARATKNNREQEPAPDGSRVEREHDVTSTSGTNRSWLPAPVADACPDPTEDVA